MNYNQKKLEIFQDCSDQIPFIDKLNFSEAKRVRTGKIGIVATEYEIDKTSNIM